MQQDPELIPPLRRQQLYWYPENVRSLLTTLSYIDMDAAQRGLLHSMKVWSWWHGWLPTDPARLARILQLKKAEVQRALPAVLDSGMFVLNADGTRTYSPELEEEMLAKEAEVSGKKRGGRMTAQRLRQQRGDEGDAGS